VLKLLGRQGSGPISDLGEFVRADMAVHVAHDYTGVVSRASVRQHTYEAFRKTAPGPFEVLRWAPGPPAHSLYPDTQIDSHSNRHAAHES
jgi:hypothetical protein